MPSLKSLALLVLVVAAPLATPAPLAAQDKEKLCNDIQRQPLKVGQWSSYRWTGGRDEGTTMRMAVVGTEAVAGTPHYWYELSFVDPSKGDKGSVIMQMLIPGFNTDVSGIRGFIMKNGSEPAMRMPEQMLGMMAGQMSKGDFTGELARRCREMELVGWEQITVPAGSFRTVHIRSTAEQTDAWVLPDAYFGLIKTTMKDGSAMVLTGRGTDARSSITETPRSMPFPR